MLETRSKIIKKSAQGHHDYNYKHLQNQYTKLKLQSQEKNT